MKKEKRDGMIVKCTLTISLIVFLGIIVALIDNYLPDQISFFGLPVAFGYMVFSIFVLVFWVIIDKLRMFSKTRERCK